MAGIYPRYLTVRGYLSDLTAGKVPSSLHVAVMLPLQSNTEALGSGSLLRLSTTTVAFATLEKADIAAKSAIVAALCLAIL